MELRHIKGFNGRLTAGGCLHAHPTVPGCFFYAASSSAVAVYEDDPNRQLQLRGHDGDVSALALSHSGALLVSAQRGFNTDVVVWDTNTLAQAFRFQEHDIEVVAAAFSADDKLLTTIGCEQELRIFVLDTRTGKIVTHTKLPEPQRVSAIAWSPVSGPCYEFATAAAYHVYIWTVDPFKGFITYERVTTGSVRRIITTLTYSSDAAWLFAGTESGDVITINVRRRAMQLMHPVAAGGVGYTGLVPAITGPGKLLVGAADGTLCAFDHTQSIHAAPPLVTVPGAISAVSPTAGPPGRLLVGTRQGGIHWVDIPPYPGQTPPATAAGLAIGRTGRVPTPATLRVFEHAHQGGITGLAFAAGASDALATASTDGTVAVWSAMDYQIELHAADPRAGNPLCVALAQDSVISGWSDGTIRCHARTAAATARGGSPGMLTVGAAVPASASNAPGQLTMTSRSPLPGSRSASPAMGSKQQAAADVTPGIRGFGPAALQVWTVPEAHRTPQASGVTAIALSNRGEYVVSGGAAGEVRVWDRASREIACDLRHHGAVITDLAVMTDDAHLLVASEDRGWSLWDVATEKLVAVHYSSMGAVRGVAMAPDQVSVATVGLDRSVSIWDIRMPTAERPAVLIPNAHAGEATAVAWHPGGAVVATGGADALVKLWDPRAVASSGGGGGQTVPAGLVGSYVGHAAGAGRVSRIAFAPDGTQLVSAGADGLLINWGVC